MTVQAQGRIDIDARVDGEDHIRAAATAGDQLTNSFGKVGAQFLKADLASKALSAGLNVLKNHIGDLASLALDYEDHVSGNERAIRAMTDATDGLLSSLQSARTANLLAAQGFNLSEKAIRAVAKAAIDHARINKQDFVPSLRAITDVIVGGRDKALRELGVDIELTGNKSQKAAKAIKLLTERYDGVRIAAANANERIAQTKNALSDVVGELGSAILKTDAFKKSAGALTTTIRDLSSSIRVMTANVIEASLADVRRLATAVSSVVPGTEKGDAGAR